MGNVPFVAVNLFLSGIISDYLVELVLVLFLSLALAVGFGHTVPIIFLDLIFIPGLIFFFPLID